MRRLLIGPFEYLRDLGAGAVRSWNRFFFAPADPTPIGLIRLLLGLLLLWDWGVLGLDLHAFLGSEGWVDPSVARLFLQESDSWAWSLWAWVPDGALWPAWAACLVVFALFTVGLGSRTMALLAWAIVISTDRRAPVTLYGFDQAVSTWMLYLAFTFSSGKALSLDRFLGRWRSARVEIARRRRSNRPLAEAIPPGVPEPSVSANLALRLIQLHLCLIYGMSGLAKLQGPAWIEGQAFGMLLGYSEFRPIDLTWMAIYPFLLMLLTHAALFLELLYPVLVWPRLLRPLVIALTMGMHVGIALTMGLYEFAAAMIVGNLAFASGPWLRSFLTGSKAAQPAGKVLYDGACPRCRASIALVGAADPDRVIEPIDLTVVEVKEVHPSLSKEACLGSMHLVRRDGRVFAGYDAMIVLARWMPLLWPLAVVGRLPGVTSMGRALYNRLAASRPRDVPCHDEVCAIPPKSNAPESRPQSQDARRSTGAESGRNPR
ncbi:hypothetical protein BH23PLA1_BH23PLA1_38920 [soil metagenome]